MAELFQGSGGESGGESRRGLDDGAEFRDVRHGKKSGGWGPSATRASRVTFPFDLVNAARSDVAVSVSSDWCVSQRRFTELTRALLVNAGLAVEVEARQYAFVKAVWLGHILNSASQAMPGRSEVRLEGCERVYNFRVDVMEVLGDEARRYFRTAADEIYTFAKTLFDRKALLSPGEKDMLDRIEVVAFQRGLQRTPWCAFDAADACTTEVMPLHERAAVSESKALVLAGANNAVDEVHVGGFEQAAMVSKVRSGGNRTTNTPLVRNGGFNV